MDPSPITGQASTARARRHRPTTDLYRLVLLLGVVVAVVTVAAVTFAATLYFRLGDAVENQQTLGLTAAQQRLEGVVGVCDLARALDRAGRKYDVVIQIPALYSRERCAVRIAAGQLAVQEARRLKADGGIP